MQLVKAMVFIMKERMMKKLKGTKGFTLGELLIVVGIISVLVAMSIPIFTSQLEKAREATDAANIRSQYAQVLTDVIDMNGSVNGKDRYGAISLKQKKDGWQNAGLQANLNSTFGRVEGSPAANGSAWVEFDGNMAILHFEGGSGSGSGESGNNPGESGNSGNSGGNTGGGTSGTADPDAINPNTNLPNSFNAATHSWEAIVAENTSYTIVPGMVYSYKGYIYFGTKAATLKNDQYTQQDLNDAVNWYAAAKYTGKIWDSSDFNNQRTDVARGDLCKVNNNYYVYKDGGSTTSGPEKSDSQWQKINLN